MSDTPIRLVVSDVDGTLITFDKDLTDETIRAARLLKEDNILLSVTSARPPLGLAMLIKPLGISAPLGAFNGALMVNADMSVIHELAVDQDLVGPIIDALSASALSVWVYQGTNWFVRDLKGPHVSHESSVVQFHPTQLKDFDAVRHDVVKIVGVSDDPTVIAKGQEALRDFHISATTSQTYYLDVTHPQANKGTVVEFLAKHFSIDTSSIASIGDGGNDVAMFERSGVSIAMGNASDEVKATALQVTTSNDDNGFANAMEQFVLPRSRL
ncbi:MAG: Cof-type HAD-IIB family hydrolase [Acidimicrobiales bacterium]